jgi:transcriptional regulator with XRE-family HTH domain
MRNDIYLIELGNKIRVARKSKKMSLMRMSALTGIDFSNLSQLERGRKNSRILSLKSIADVLKVDVKDFI